MPRSLVFTLISPKIFRTLSSESWSLIDKGIPVTSIVSWREYWTFAQHYLPVSTTLSISFVFTFFVTAKSAFSFLKYPGRCFTSVVTFVVCETKLASVCSASCTNSGLLSLFRTTSVWVVAVTTDSLQYLQNYKRFVTYEAVWVGVLRHNFLCKNASLFTQLPNAKIPTGKFWSNSPLVNSPWWVPTWNIPTHVFKYSQSGFSIFLCFHYCHRYHYFYLKDCFVILYFKSAEVRLVAVYQKHL